MRRYSEERQLERTERERDLYLRLLQLGSQTEIQPFLEEALRLVVEITGAHQGYLELRDAEVEEDGPHWFMARGFSEQEVSDVRLQLSRGIIAEALATGQVIDTPSAMLDERFSSRQSVRISQIQAVLCVPIEEGPSVGVLYLQGRDERGPFTAEDRTCCQIFARHLAPLGTNLLLRSRLTDQTDPTREFREKYKLEGIVGRSSALAALLREVALVIPLDVNVLLLGESGTGKSQLAYVIHENGPRSAQPFVEVNSAALPEGLVESELFGAIKGSHSTADRHIPGKVAAAQHGTLFLDEVGDLSPLAQSKLLQLLQSKIYYPLGATEPSTADIRLIAATNTDLEAAVAEGQFREDLFYRLQVLPIRVPSLAERRTDIPELIQHFCEVACRNHGLDRLELSRSALRAAETTDWPGNHRQLEHAVEAAVIRAAGEKSPRLKLEHLFPENRAATEEPDEARTFQDATLQFQEGLLRETLEETGWNVAETARRLDLARSYIYNLIRRFGLRRQGD